MISWNRWIGSTIVFRPELRYDRAYDAPAYDNGAEKSQLMFAADMILFYQPHSARLARRVDAIHLLVPSNLSTGSRLHRYAALMPSPVHSLYRSK